MKRDHPSETRLHDLVDELLDPSDREAVEQHLRVCAPCRATVGELRSLLEGARDLGPVLPGRELLPGIRAGIRHQRTVSRWLVAAAVAAVLFGAAWFGWRGNGADRPTVASPREAGLVEAFLAAEIEYEAANRALFDTLNADESLSPETWAVLERNVEIIDRAIVEVREALRSDTGQAADGHLLTTLHRKKMQLLWRASRLSAERGV